VARGLFKAITTRECIKDLIPRGSGKFDSGSTMILRSEQHVRRDSEIRRSAVRTKIAGKKKRRMREKLRGIVVFSSVGGDKGKHKGKEEKREIACTIKKSVGTEQIFEARGGLEIKTKHWQARPRTPRTMRGEIHRDKNTRRIDSSVFTKKGRKESLTQQNKCKTTVGMR